MNKPKTVFSIAAFLFVSLLSLTNSSAQTPVKQQSEPSYEVVLQVLIGSNAAIDKSAVIPQRLSGIVKELKTNYSFSNYHLTSTYFQRVAYRGNVNSNSISNESDQNQDSHSPTFSDLALNGLQNTPDANGQHSISFENFRFGQKVPIKTTDFKDGGKSNSFVNYEYVGLQMQKLNLSLNTPTIIGSLLTSKPDEIMFLVLTVKPAEQ